jgi:glycosidase
MNRFLWMAGGDAKRLKLASTLLLTLPGMPVIYYGTEVGLSQRHDGAMENAEARLPMLWGADQNQDVLEHLQQLGRMRRDSVALRRGTRRTLLADLEVFAYERVFDEESVLIALNFSEQPQRRDLPGAGAPVELGPLGSLVMEASTIRS